MVAEELSRTQIFVAVIAAVGLVGASIIQNWRGFSKTHKATVSAAEEAANGVGQRTREEMRSAVRDITGQLAVVKENQEMLKTLDRKLELLLAQHHIVLLDDEPKTIRELEDDAE